MRKPRCYSEVLNDLDDELFTLFAVLRDRANAARLRELVRLTPYSRTEFEAAYEPAADALEVARRLIVRSLMGFGSDGANASIRTGFRSNSKREGSTPAHDWMHYPDAIESFTTRLAGVVIENRDALEVMGAHDSSETLHYVDPPYLPSTRSAKSRKGGERYHAYRHEMSTADHRELLKALRELRGMVVLSGYPSRLYDRMLRGWTKIERPARADGGAERLEVLWLNPHAAARQPQPRLL